MLNILQEKDFSNIFQKSSSQMEPDHASQLNHFKCALNLLLSVNKTRMRPENSQWSISSFYVISRYFSGSNRKLSVASISELFFFPFSPFSCGFIPNLAGNYSLHAAAEVSPGSRFGWALQHHSNTHFHVTMWAEQLMCLHIFFLIQERILKNA